MRAANHKVYGGLLNDVRVKVNAGKMSPDACFAAQLCSDQAKLNLDELDILFLAGTL